MNEFLDRWNFVRSETLEILNSLSDDDLLFKPQGNNWQPLYYQFGCIIRTQLIYAEAANTGKMDFALFSSDRFPAKDTSKTVNLLASMLESSNKEWIQSVSKTKSVLWPNGDRSMSLHIANLAEHERLHHGQLIAYFTLAGFELPSNFKRNWAL